MRLGSGLALGIRRERVGEKFRYRGVSGKLVRDPRAHPRAGHPAGVGERANLPAPHGHQQAVGYDAKGRKQYRYHPAFRDKREGGKYSRLLAFGQALAEIRRRVKAGLAAAGLPKVKVVAAVVTLLDRTPLRVGNPEYAKANHSFGLSTLLDRHATVGSGRPPGGPSSGGGGGEDAGRG